MLNEVKTPILSTKKDAKKREIYLALMIRDVLN